MHPSSSLRPFQAAVVARARDANVVMVGATGIGKTFVAIALLSEQDYSNGQRAFVLAPTRQLVWQIHAKISAGTTLRAVAFCGRTVEQWDEHEWAKELLLTRVVVCTPEVLRSALERGVIPMHRINLLVFDECHHVTKRHPYAHVIKMYDTKARDKMPRIFGTTACPTKECAANLHAEIFKVELQKHETVAYAAVAPIILTEYEKEDKRIRPLPMTVTGEDDDPEDLLDQVYEHELRASGRFELVEILKELKVTSVLRKLLRKRKSDLDDTRCEKLIRKFVLACVEIFTNFGVWCVYRFIELEIERSAVNATLLLYVPGSMYGFDPAAKKLLLLAQAQRNACSYAATKRLERVAALLEERLIGSDDSTTTTIPQDDGDEEDENSMDEEEKIEDIEGTTINETIQSHLQGIIFVTTRAECRVVCDYLNERFGEQEDSRNDSENESDHDDESDESEAGDPRFACILGQASSSRDTASYGLPKMEETLGKFERGSIQFLVSTAVSIEGVDFPQCSMIIVAGRIQAARKLIQLRGRARHQDGVVYYLCEKDDREHAEHFRTMKDTADAIDVLDFQHDKEESVLKIPRSQAAQQLAGFDFFPVETRLHIDATGAVLDLDSSISRLNMFCQTLPKNLGAGDLKDMYTYVEKTVQKRPLFCAKLSLPQALQLPSFESGFMHSKATAKAAVAFMACKHLYENGLLDDSLNSVYRKAKAQDLSYLIKKLHV